MKVTRVDVAEPPPHPERQGVAAASRTTSRWPSGPPSATRSAPRSPRTRRLSRSSRPSRGRRSAASRRTRSRPGDGPNTGGPGLTTRPAVLSPATVPFCSGRGYSPAPMLPGLSLVAVILVAASPVERLMESVPADSLARPLARFETSQHGAVAAEAALALGRLHFARGEYRQAAAAFARATPRFDPARRGEPRYWAGLAWLGAGEPAAARGALEEAARAGSPGARWRCWAWRCAGRRSGSPSVRWRPCRRCWPRSRARRDRPPSSAPRSWPPRCAVRSWRGAPVSACCASTPGAWRPCAPGRPPRARGWERQGRDRREAPVAHAPHGAVPPREARATGRLPLLPAGRLLRDVLRGRGAGRAPLLGLTLTSRNKQDPEPIPMCGIPWHQRDAYLAACCGWGTRSRSATSSRTRRRPRGWCSAASRRCSRPAPSPGTPSSRARPTTSSRRFGRAADMLGVCLADASTGEVKLAESPWADAPRLPLAPAGGRVADPGARRPRGGGRCAPRGRAARDGRGPQHGRRPALPRRGAARPRAGAPAAAELLADLPAAALAAVAGAGLPRPGAGGCGAAADAGRALARGRGSALRRGDGAPPRAVPAAAGGRGRATPCGATSTSA